MTKLGVHWERDFVSWAALEPKPGQLDMFQVSALAGGLASLPAGTKVIIDVVRTPQWESGSTDPVHPPQNPSDYAAFVGAMAKRFAGKVAAWEIWNEEDDSLWWAPGPDPAAYAALLRAAYPAIKAGDPKAKVIVGGLTGNDFEYLSQLYANGAKGSFDAVGVHTDDACELNSPYEFERNGATDRRIERWSFLGYRTVHETMLANGDDKPIWMTELGWNTSSQRCDSGVYAGQKAGGVTPAHQAKFLLQAYHCLAQTPYVQVGIWFGLLDTEPFGTPIGSYGLLESNLTPKPAFAALAHYAHHGDQLRERCGDFSGPSIKLAHPTRDDHYQGFLPIVLSASDRLGVKRITIYYDHHQIRNFSNSHTPRTLRGHWLWRGARFLSPGRHMFTVLAIDKRGNRSHAKTFIWRGGHR
jgi:hypothetical protein